MGQPVVIVKPQKKVVQIKSRGAKGDPGETPVTTYTHNQVSPALVWTVQHNLGIYPAGIQVIDTDGNEVDGIVSYASVNVTLITFYEAIAGVAYLS